MFIETIKKSERSMIEYICFVIANSMYTKSFNKKNLEVKFNTKC